MADVSSPRMAAGFAFLICAFGVLGTAVLAQQVAVTIPEPQRAPRALPPLRGIPEPITRLPGSAAELRETLSARVRLRPDRRVLIALAQVQRLRGAPAHDVDARWRDDHWEVSAGRSPADTLAEAPDFEDLLALVLRAAQAVPVDTFAPGAAAPEAASWPILTPSRHAVPLLAALDAAWASGARGPALVAAAARGLTALAFETPDAVDGADLLAGRALAAHAWARSLGRREVEAEALLAWHMGYRGAAARVAEALPEASAVRAFVRNDDARLRALAGRGDAPEAARYLWFRRLVERREAAEAVAWKDAHLREGALSLPVAGFVLDAYGASPISVYRGLVRDQSGQRVVALEREAGVAPADAPAAEQVLPRLAALDARRRDAGPFLDAAILVARDDAAVLSALGDDLDFRLRVWASPDAARELAGGLASSPPPPFRDFATWASNLARVSAGELSPETLMADLAANTWLGASLFGRTYEALAGRVPPYDARRRMAFERYAARLDGRPMQRALHAQELGDALGDVPREEAACDGVLRLAPTPEAVAWCLGERADSGGLLRMANDASLTPAARTHATRLAARRGAPGPVEAAWRALADGGGYEATRAYGRWLEDLGRLDDALAVARAWLRAHGDEPGLAAVHTRAEASRFLRKRGDAAGAWALVEGDVPGMAGSSLEEGARALAALRRFDEAERVAREHITRYRSGDGVALLAEVLWLRGDAARAAEEVARGAPLLTNVDWRDEIGTAFARTFRAATPDAARAAFGALARTAVDPRDLGRACAAFLDVHRPDLAAATYGALDFSRLPQTPIDHLGPVLQEYAYRKKADGAEAAAAWVRGRVAPPLRAPLSMFAYPFRASDLLWSVCEPSGSPSNVDFVWLLRAADGLRLGAADPHRAELEAHYAAVRASDYATMGRYVVSGGDLAPVLALGVSPKRRTEVAYYVGLRAVADGRVADASDWFQLATLTGNDHDGEYGWALTTLRAWADRDEPLAAIAARPWATADDAPAAPASAAPEAPAAGGRRHGHHARHGEERHGRRRH